MSKPYKKRITAREIEILSMLDAESYLSEVATRVAQGDTASTPGAVSCILKRLVRKGLATSRTEVNPRYRSGHRVYYQRTIKGTKQLPQVA